MSALTRQQIFDKVCRHLHAQPLASMTGDARGCAYRGEGGLRCAVGCLIPDELYDPWMDGAAHATDVSALWEHYGPKSDIAILLGFGLGDARLTLLGDLQRAHDAYMERREPRPNWLSDALRHRLRAIAEKFELSTLTLDALP